MNLCFLWGLLWWLTAASTTVDWAGFICNWKVQVLITLALGCLTILLWFVLKANLIKNKTWSSSIMRTVLEYKIEKWVLLLQYSQCMTAIKWWSCVVVIFCYLCYFVEGALCIPWKHTSQGHQGKSMLILISLAVQYRQFKQSNIPYHNKEVNILIKTWFYFTFFKICSFWYVISFHMLFSRVKKPHCYDNIINCTFHSQSLMVRYFIGVYIIKRTLHGRLKIQNFSSHVEKYFACLLGSLNIFQHLKKNFITLCSHVISSVYLLCSKINLLLLLY